MLVPLGTLTLHRRPILIPTLLNVRKSNWISNHHICTNTASKIEHMEILTLTISQC